MKKSLWKLSVFLGLLVIGLLMLSAVAIGEDVVDAKVEARPNTLTGPGTVQININVTNISDSETPMTVTLYDPANNIVSGFGSGGTAHLAAGASQSYSGTWAVTAEQLSKGKITYAIQFTMTNGNGEKVSSRKPFSQVLKKNTAKLDFKINRVTPPGSVVEGQTVKVMYQCVNDGTIDITNISIKDPEITKEPLTLPVLKAGESYTLEASFIAGTTSKTSKATCTYEYVSNGKTEKATSESDVKVISVTIPDIIAKLTASESIVNAGTKVWLTCVITNRSDLSYSQLKVTDPTIQTVETGLSLGPGKSTTVKREVTVNNTTTYKFTIEGVDSTGTPETIESNECVVQTIQDEMVTDTITTANALPIELSILAEGDREIIYSEPSPIIFHVKVTNFGTAAVDNVRIESGPDWDKKTIKTIARIEPGQTIDFLKELSAMKGGMFQFSATTKNSAGKDVSVKSNEFRVSFTATKPPPTPTPSPTPEPTEQPAPEPTEKPSAPFGDPDTESGGAGKILLYVLAGLLLVILLAVGMLFYLDHRKNRPAQSSGHGGQNIVIDSLQRNPHRDYARAPKRGRNEGSRPARPEKPAMPAYGADDDEPGTPEPAKMRIYDIETPEQPAGSSAKDDSAFRRPAASGGLKDDISDIEEETAPRRIGTRAGDDESMTQTEVFSRDYLSKIRHAAAGEPKDPQEDKKRLSDEDAALLSGSTGQYRLSRKAGSVHSPALTPAAAPETPEAPARKPRAERGKDSDLSNFYGDDDDEPSTRRTKRQ